MSRAAFIVVAVRSSDIDERGNLRPTAVVQIAETGRVLWLNALLGAPNAFRTMIVEEMHVRFCHPLRCSDREIECRFNVCSAGVGPVHLHERLVTTAGQTLAELTFDLVPDELLR